MERRPGFSLIELIIALVLLTVTLVGIQAATSRYLHTVATGDRQAVAAQIARDRIEEIRIDPIYDGLAARYAETNTSVLDPPEFTRDTRITTVVDRTGDQITEFTRITVTVRGPGLIEPVTRSTSRVRP